ncbi:MAG: hypothetical protein LUD54_01650 [Oscillospiraceae bacterium]|nr:hypothetical protein [Oscillospiraceae bacterium]
MKKFAATVLLFALLLSGCGEETPTEPEATPTVDPYAGMVQVESGYGTSMWVTEYEDVPRSGLMAEDFSDGVYIGDDYAVYQGIDVSEHQGEIDWLSAAESGVSFALIRAGYRGYGSAGVLSEDTYFTANMDGAAAIGVARGVYFFSQAVSAEEAAEEAAFLLELLAPYGPEALSLPVYYDWEDISNDEARTDGLDGETITDCAVAFCTVLSAAGYEAGVYAYRYLGYFSYDLSRLTDWSLWIGAVSDYPDFYYAHDIWQYSTTGTVSGIATAVDLDLRFVPLPDGTGDAPTDTPDAETDAASHADAAEAEASTDAAEAESGA